MRHESTGANHEELDDFADDRDQLQLTRVRSKADSGLTGSRTVAIHTLRYQISTL